MVKTLIERNRIWSAKVLESDPGYFARLANLQTPRYFWIGCSDSRVPANVVAGLDPGEVFVHRNVGNVIHTSDMNMLSALEYAVEALGVARVIVCGHYGCGGVKAATEGDTRHLTDHWLEPIRRLAAAHAAALDRFEGGEARLDRLAELNVLDGVGRVSETPILRKAWARGAEVSVHGLIYGLKDGRLRDLDCAVTGR
jgi:carbonic anhydrase